MVTTMYNNRPNWTPLSPITINHNLLFLKPSNLLLLKRIFRITQKRKNSLRDFLVSVIKDITWPCGATTFIFSCLKQTSELFFKINFVSRVTKNKAKRNKGGFARRQEP